MFQPLQPYIFPFSIPDGIYHIKNVSTQFNYYEPVDLWIYIQGNALRYQQLTYTNTDEEKATKANVTTWQYIYNLMHPDINKSGYRPSRENDLLLTKHLNEQGILKTLDTLRDYSKLQDELKDIKLAFEKLEKERLEQKRLEQERIEEQKFLKENDYLCLY
ncbi:MAG: hypothetical protein VKJ04_04250 [Vampirovibrionales bacterium]|nr:hypothetical protein [Vampirovibrionales bacterium]